MESGVLKKERVYDMGDGEVYKTLPSLLGEVIYRGVSKSDGDMAWMRLCEVKNDAEVALYLLCDYIYRDSGRANVMFAGFRKLLNDSPSLPLLCKNPCVDDDISGATLLFELAGIVVKEKDGRRFIEDDNGCVIRIVLLWRVLLYYVGSCYKSDGNDKSFLLWLLTMTFEAVEED